MLLSVARGAIDCLTQQVGVAVMTRIFLDHMQEDPPDIDPAFRTIIPTRHHVIE